MRNLFLSFMASLAIVVIFSSAVLAQTAPFDKNDISGIWGRFGGREGRGNFQGSAFPEGGDAGFGNDVPPMTPEGLELLEANKTGYGRPLGSQLAAERTDEHFGRRRAVLPATGNDPTAACTPGGLTRAILSTYFSPFEFFKGNDRMVQHFEWTNEWREIWMDGRELPKDPDIYKWNGYSIGRWEGDTFVVESFGFEPTTWVDHFGYPHSEQMRLQERYRRIAADRMELVMTITDPKIYTKPWVSQKKVFRLLPRTESTIDGWWGLVDDRCVPAEEQDFNEKVRDPAGGLVK